MTNITNFKQLVQALTLFTFIIMMANSCQEIVPYQVEDGVSKKLNDHRKKTISKLEYELFFNIPLQKQDPIAGNLVIKLDLAETSKPLVLDFKESGDNVLNVSSGEKSIEYRFEKGHIIIPKKYLSVGPNELEIDFIAGDLSLNRNEDYLYTLFVPDRASTAFPCFDQPNLKAAYQLTLEVPSEWEAVANGGLIEKKDHHESAVFVFSQTKPISTYLFAFATGKFSRETRVKNNRSMTFYHRETDQEKIDRNMDEIFDLHFDAIEWMEEYTGIAMPFGKFDFVAIPSFQYGGMEHPGSILYRSGKLFLDPTATQEDVLDRATLIAHETAHMWFGDLVTMAWFDDVWLKEVFANFMAAKMVNPAFPEIDHDQAFLIDHYPKAYAIDRTEGANPIKQDLENMNMAGTLYGSIIYHKAPIVMLQLENITGEEKLRAGLQVYLKEYSYSNADWDELVAILDQLTDTDLKSWSEVWVKEAGMPSYELVDKGGKIILVQNDPDGKNRIWPQKLSPLIIQGDDEFEQEMFVAANNIEVPFKEDDDLVLLNGKGLGYGYFRFSEKDIEFAISEKIFSLPAKTRAVIYLSVWENMLNANLDLYTLADAFDLYLKNETDELNVNLLLKYYQHFFWKYSDQSKKQHLSKRIESLLWEKLKQVSNPSLRSAYFKAYQNTAISEDGLENLYHLWNGEMKIEGFKLSNDDMTTLAFELVVRQSEESENTEIDHILEYQLGSIDNIDKRKRMEFIMPALSIEEAVRDSFFETLKDPANREHEPWVLTALHYLHHPLRAESSRKYILPSLRMLEEIQVTGDIFFPMGWLEATLGGHRTNKSANFVTIFLNNYPDLDPKLRQKVLQAGDPLYRAVRLSSK